MPGQSPRAAKHGEDATVINPRTRCGCISAPWLTTSPPSDQPRQHAAPYLGIQTPTVQQHKIAFNFIYCLRIQHCHRLMSLQVRSLPGTDAINPQPVLAMPATITAYPTRHL